MSSCPCSGSGQLLVSCCDSQLGWGIPKLGFSLLSTQVVFLDPGAWSCCLRPHYSGTWGIGGCSTPWQLSMEPPLLSCFLPQWEAHHLLPSSFSCGLEEPFLGMLCVQLSCIQLPCRSRLDPSSNCWQWEEAACFPHHLQQRTTGVSAKSQDV